MVDGVMDVATFILREYTLSIVMTVLAIIVIIGFARIGGQKRRRMQNR